LDVLAFRHPPIPQTFKCPENVARQRGAWIGSWCWKGFIARYVGDGVLIYFGWPEARETDAERAESPLA
jgi:class 3 adenylate cyclase